MHACMRISDFFFLIDSPAQTNLSLRFWHFALQFHWFCTNLNCQMRNFAHTNNEFIRYRFSINLTSSSHTVLEYKQMLKFVWVVLICRNVNAIAIECSFLHQLVVARRWDFSFILFAFASLSNTQSQCHKTVRHSIWFYCSLIHSL